VSYRSKTGLRICLNCFRKETNFKLPRGVCPSCRFDRSLTHRHPVSGKLICRGCVREHKRLSIVA
jgi:hypothetical protein